MNREQATLVFKIILPSLFVIGVIYINGVSKLMQPIYVIRICYRDKCNGGHLEHVQ